MAWDIVWAGVWPVIHVSV